MPELLRLRTPDFEFSVWTNDIRARSNVYRETMEKRANLLRPPSPELRFLPAQRVTSDFVYDATIDLPISDITEENNGIEQTKNTEAKIESLELKSPLFFENTQYQFEWVFFDKVTEAKLAHRSQTINESFRFASRRGQMPARLTGTINTANDVGWMRLPVQFVTQGKEYTQNISFEVLPTKMALHQDLPLMYKAIDDVFPLWRFSLVEKTEQDAAQSTERGHFPLMWLANFSQLRERFEKGLKVICAAPHSRLQPTVANIKAEKLKGRLPYKLGEKIKQDFANGLHDKRYRVEKKQLSVDTPENRFIKMAVTQCKRQLSGFEAKIRESNQAPERQRLSNSFLDEMHSWQQPLQKVLNQSFLKDVSDYTGLNRESLVLQQKTGYSAVYRVWQELKFYLNVFGNQSSISMKSVAEIYEVWCFLQIKNILEDNLGFGSPLHRKPYLKKGIMDELKLVNGDKGAFEFFREEDGVRASLYHEKSYGRKTNEIRTFLLTHKPDIVLEIIFPDGRKFVWLFDAKYRIESIKTSEQGSFLGKPRLKDTEKWNKADLQEKSHLAFKIQDGVPDDAINQMHRYRDALIQLDNVDKKSRPVFGAFALYPGFFNQQEERNPYRDAIDEIGIGAFALLPNDGTNAHGSEWLVDFLKDQIGEASRQDSDYSLKSVAESLYVREPARIPYLGMRQVLYSDLALTVNLGGQQGRKNSYFEAFTNGTANWYHLPKKTFDSKFKQHIAYELSYLGIASNSTVDSRTKSINKLWPVQNVQIKPRNEIGADIAGKDSDSNELYYLFQLGRPLSLQTCIERVPHRPVINALRLTTLKNLQEAQIFKDIEQVYKEAINSK